MKCIGRICAAAAWGAASGTGPSASMGQGGGRFLTSCRSISDLLRRAGREGEVLALSLYGSASRAVPDIAMVDFRFFFVGRLGGRSFPPQSLWVSGSGAF